jgi:hypothetical protein
MSGQLFVRGPDVGVEISGKRLGDDRGPDLLTDGGEALHVVGVEVAESLIDQIGQPGVPDEAAIGVGSGRKAVGYADTEVAELRDHLAEAGVLPADLLDVAKTELGEPSDVAAWAAGALGHGDS